jgi:hypothetical protein
VVVDSAGDAVVSTEPAASADTWSPVEVGNTPLYDVACPSDTFCAAVDGDGYAVFSNDPAGGAWHRTPASSAPLAGISCPSTTLCVAVDVDGDVLSSTNPAGGSWQQTHLDGIGEPTAIDCASTRLCAVTAGDAIAVSNDPTGGATSWRTSIVVQDGLLDDLSCPTERLCVAVDTLGNALVGVGDGSVPPTPPPVDIPADTVATPQGSTADQIRALLLRALGLHGAQARIRPLLKRGRHVTTLRTPVNGIVLIRWTYTPRNHGGAKRVARPIVVAKGSHTFARPGSGRIAIRLTRAGRRLLADRNRIALTAHGTFAGAERITASTPVTLTR